MGQAMDNITSLSSTMGGVSTRLTDVTSQVNAIEGQVTGLSNVDERNTKTIFDSFFGSTSIGLLNMNGKWNYKKVLIELQKIVL